MVLSSTATKTPAEILIEVSLQVRMESNDRLLNSRNRSALRNLFSRLMPPEEFKFAILLLVLISKLKGAQY